jgi:hypothetical protein
MKKINSKIGLIALAAVLVVSTTVISCKKKFDEPPTFVDPNIAATITVKQLKAMHTVIGAFDTIKTDQVLVGVVVGDDKSGNLYKSLSIQDATGGISLRLDAANLYTTYPVGRKLYIKLKGLVLGDYGGMTQIGGGVDNSDPTRPGLGALASIFFDKYIVAGSLGNPVPIKTITDLSLLKTDLQDTFQNTLIRLDNFEFSVGDTTKTYGDPTKAASALNYTIKNCAGQSIILRNSSYATFSSASIPNGNGSIVALYTFFNGTKQLTLRDTSDIQFNGTRCAVFEEDFEGVTSGADINIAGWKNVAEVGGVTFKGGSFSGNKYAQATAFNAAGSPAVVTSWLISPAVNLTGYATPVLSFGTIDGFDNGATLKVFVSTNYNPANPPSSATWTQLPAAINSGHTAGYGPTFLYSGALSLAAYSGQSVYIGFRYDGANPAAGTKKTTTFEIDNVKISKN